MGIYLNPGNRSFIQAKNSMIWNFSIRGYIQRTSVSLSAMQGVLASHMPQE